jgi:hypothetical protein
MDVERAAEELTERKVVRRGLLTGIAALGAAAMVKLHGAGRADAANGDPLIVGSSANVSTALTLWTATTAASAGLQVVNGGATVSGKSGIVGVTDAVNGGGVRGYNDVAGGFGTGGDSGSGIGVRGQSTTGTGVQGSSNSFSSAGVRGVGMSSGFGVRGVSNIPSDLTGNGTGNGGRSTGGPGVTGESVNAAGVIGQSVNQPGVGVDGISTNGIGARGTSTNWVGVVGISSAYHGLYGSTSSAVGAGFVGENLAPGGFAGYFAGHVQITGNLLVGGAKNAVIKMQDGTTASVYCQESPEPFFEDFGRAQLAGGVANVALEREFATLVAGGDYMVFLTPEGESRGLYVSRRSATSFEVRDPGNSNISFTYRIVTKRKDIEGKRFARVVDNVGPGLATARVALGAAGPLPQNNAPQSGPTPPAVVPQPTAPGPNPTQPGPTNPTPTTNPTPGQPPSIAGG